MGLFDTINAELTCPTTLEKKMRGIQVKWVEYSFALYNVGEIMSGYGEDEDEPLSEREPLGNEWRKEQYLCSNCSTTKQWNGITVVDRSVFHPAYINMQDQLIKEVLSEEDYKARGLDKNKI
jgi:hypothetical protein